MNPIRPVAAIDIQCTGQPVNGSSLCLFLNLLKREAGNAE